MKRNGCLIFLLLLAVAMLVGGILLGLKSYKNLKSYSRANGKIVDISSERNSEGKLMYAPVIEYLADSDSLVTFETDWSSSSRSGMTIGKEVEVLYDPDDYEKAIKNGFMDLWLGPLILGGIGLIFFIGIISTLFLANNYKDKLQQKRAKDYTKTVSATIIDVRHGTTAINNKYPFIIEAQWLDTATNKVHLFKSKNFWYDPSDFLKDEITVKLDPKNPKKYWMDTTFLPESA